MTGIPAPRTARGWCQWLLDTSNAHVLDALSARQLAWQVLDITEPRPDPATPWIWWPPGTAQHDRGGAPADGWDGALDSDKAHERRVVAREDWWELNHGDDGERP